VRQAATRSFEFTGLAVGESQTRGYSRPCEETRQALVDPLTQVGESNEENNNATFSNSFY
jgi:subtilase family serine protease